MAIYHSMSMDRPGRRLSPAAIRRAKAALGVKFPPDYRRFLLVHNSGKPRECYFVLRAGKERQIVWVADFCQINSSKIDALSLRGQRAMLSRYAAEGEAVPAGCFACGSTGGGCSILLYTLGPRRGQVWLKDWDLLPDASGSTSKPTDAMFKLAPSFQKFVERLCSQEEAERRATQVRR